MPLLAEVSDQTGSLDKVDSVRLRALSSFARADYADACQAFGDLRNQQQSTVRWEVTATLAHGDCLLADQRVLADPASASGYRFATSYNFVDSLFGGLLDRNVAKPMAYAHVLPRLERVRSLDKRILRRGSRADGAVMYAQPAIAGDSVAYVPLEISRSGAPLRQGNEASLDAVMERNRRSLIALGSSWVRLAPGNADAHERLAKYLEASGNFTGPGTSALDELHSARKLVEADRDRSPKEVIRRLRLAMTEVGILVRIGNFAAAGALADTALAVVVDPRMDDALKNTAEDFQWRLAALRGRVSLVNSIEQRYANLYEVMLPTGIERPPLQISRDAIALTNYTAFGEPRDSIVAAWKRIERALPSLVAPSKLEAMRLALLRRPLMMAAPSIGPQASASLGPTSDPVGSILVSYARGDRARAMRELLELRRLHAERAPGEISMDVTFQEAWLSAALGDTASAVRLLDNALNGLSRAPPSMLDSPLSIAALVRAMMLRSSLAKADGDSGTAERWSEAVRLLWGDGDRGSVSQDQR
jgi:tetratricopeptide (TPR) repeat protein